MEKRVTRLKRYKDSKKHKKIKIIQVGVVFLLVVLLTGGIYAVDLTVRESLLLQNQQIFHFKEDDVNYTIHLFGKDYGIERAPIDGTYRTIKDEMGKIKTKTKRLITNVVER